MLTSENIVVVATVHARDLASLIATIGYLVIYVAAMALLVRSGVLEPLEQASFGLLPVSFTLIGLSVNVASLDGEMLVEFLVITLAACLGKLLGAGLSAWISGLSWRDAASVGVLMNTRGARSRHRSGDRRTGDRRQGAG